MDYKFIFNFYKTFCTKISDIKDFFGNDSTFFFVGDSGKTFIAYGKEEIERQIDEQFWSSDETNIGKTIIAYNISIERKEQKVCQQMPSYLFEESPSEVAVTIIGCLKSIHTEKDIPLTKGMGRRFVQTFLISKSDTKYIRYSVLALLAPTTDMFSHLIEKELSSPLPTVSGDIFNSQQKTTESVDSVSELNFKKIVQNIDKLIDENKDSNKDFCLKKVESVANELMPISVNELLDDNSSEKKRQDINQSIDLEQYLSDIWTKSWSKSSKDIENVSKNKINENNEKQIAVNNRETNDHNCGTSFADVLRDNLQSWQNLKIDDKPQEVRIITNCVKSKLKQNSLKHGLDRKQDFFGQQSITIMGAQNLEDICDNQIVFVANIPIGYPKNQFRNMFDIYGKVLSIKLIERIGVSFAFIYFDS